MSTWDRLSLILEKCNTLIQDTASLQTGHSALVFHSHRTIDRCNCLACKPQRQYTYHATDKLKSKFPNMAISLFPPSNKTTINCPKSETYPFHFRYLLPFQNLSGQF